MTKGLVDKAERIAISEFDKWNDCTGVIPDTSGYYGEILECILDAVHIGIQMALLGKVRYDGEGAIDRSGKVEDKND